MRLGTVNAQTEWLLERSDAKLPRHLPHAYLRVRDVMRTKFPVAQRGDPVRNVGLLMASEGMDLVPVVDDDGVLTGLLTERGLARRYIRESREASRLDVPTPVGSIVDVLGGELHVGEASVEVEGRVWVQAMHSTATSRVQPGDVVVIGDRPEATASAIARAHRAARAQQRHAADRGCPRARRRVRHLRRHLAAGLLRHVAHGHAVGALPGAGRDRPADRAQGRARARHRRPDQGRALPRGGRGRRRRQAGRRRDALGPRQPRAAPRPPRRPRRARAERARHRGGRDRRDPRPPPHRLDRDEAARDGDLRPRRLDRRRSSSSASARPTPSPRRRPRRCCSARSSPTPSC